MSVLFVVFIILFASIWLGIENGIGKVQEDVNNYYLDMLQRDCERLLSRMYKYKGIIYKGKQ